MKLETTPETSRASSGVIGVKMIITGMANCGERGEKGGEKAFFGSDRSSRNANLCPFVCPSIQISLSKLSISIFGHQIFHDDFGMTSG